MGRPPGDPVVERGAGRTGLGHAADGYEGAPLSPANRPET
jgi:hypothetical protein